MNKVLKIKKYALFVAGYLGVLYLAQTFLFHGIEAIKVNPGFLSLITEFGIPYGLSKVMLFGVGIIDLFVAFALLFYRSVWVFLYAGIWPTIPIVMGFLIFDYFSIGYLLLTPTVALLSFLAFERHRKIHEKMNVLEDV